MEQNLISVVIPTYNRAHLIMRSIESVLNQTYNNIELIIVDDGSTDGTDAIVKSIKDARVVYIKQSNQGACAARNNGINQAKGEYIAFQDSDDIWHSNKLERQLEILKTVNAKIVLCGRMIKVGETNVQERSIHKTGYIRPNVLPFGLGTQTFFASINVFREESFDNELVRWQDFEVLLRIQKKYNLYFLDEGLVDYTIQNDSITKDASKLLTAMSTIMRKHPNFINEYSDYNCIVSEFLNVASSCNDKENKKLLIELSTKFRNSPKMILKRWLVQSNLYPAIKRLL